MTWNEIKNYTIVVKSGYKLADQVVFSAGFKFAGQFRNCNKEIAQWRNCPADTLTHTDSEYCYFYYISAVAVRLVK